ncbi:MAG: hypothetical protein ABW166_06740 [Sedimenticola sp.]
MGEAGFRWIKHISESYRRSPGAAYVHPSFRFAIEVRAVPSLTCAAIDWLEDRFGWGKLPLGVESPSDED